MNVLVLTNMYPSREYPYYGIFVKNINKIINECGYTIETECVVKANSKFQKTLAYIRYFLVSIVKINFKKYAFVYIHYPAFSAIPLLFLMRRNVKLIVNIHGNDLVPETLKDVFFRKFTDLAVKKANNVVLPSEYFKHIFMERYPSFDKNKIFISPSGGVDKKIFYPTPNSIDKNHLKLSRKYKYIGFASRIEKGKGWDLYLDMVEHLVHKLPNYRFVLVGSGSEEAALEAQLHSRKLEKYVIKFGYLDQCELSEIFRLLDVFCFPSLRKSESLGLVGLEAMACGAIVVSSSGTGPESYITDGETGFIISPLTSESLAKKVFEISQISETEKTKIRSSAYKKVKCYSTEVVEKNFASFLSQI